MLLEFIPYPVLSGMGILFLLLIILRLFRRRLSYLFFFSVAWLSLLLAIGLTVFPIPLSVGEYALARMPFTEILARVNLVPFFFNRIFPNHPWLSRFDIIGNVLMTIPLGFSINFIAPMRAKRAFRMIVVIGGMFEAAQLVISLYLGLAYRNVDINDVMMNAAGAFFGYVAFRILAWLYVSFIRLMELHPHGLIEYIHQIALRVDGKL